MSKTLTLSIDKSGPKHQASLNVKDEAGIGHGYRLLGPKYIGDSRLIAEEELSLRDANEVRSILDEVFPVGADSEAYRALEAERNMLLRERNWLLRHMHAGEQKLFQMLAQTHERVEADFCPAPATAEEVGEWRRNASEMAAALSASQPMPVGEETPA